MMRMSERTIEELRKLWDGSLTTVAPEHSALRAEEALWEYWRRVADGEHRLDLNELQRALRMRPAGIGNVVGELCQTGLFPKELVDEARRLLVESSTDDATAGIAHLDAFSALNSIQENVESKRGENLRALQVKGAFWAAVRALDLLPPEDAVRLVQTAEENGLFTRGQRHELRLDLVRKLRRDGRPGSQG